MANAERKFPSKILTKTADTLCDRHKHPHTMPQIIFDASVITATTSVFVVGKQLLS
ncbi:MAG: hypothetical protein Q8P26_05790 [Candidatus Levybacteria bacterium]|nr:hypothetical protein [Candidatus Levybacteria bacterium]